MIPLRSPHTFPDALVTTLALTAFLTPGATSPLTAVPPPNPPALGGVVLDDGGAPVPGARVELLPLPSNHGWANGVLDGRASSETAAKARSGDAGRFRLKSPGPGLWSVVVQAEGFVPMRYRLLPLVRDTELPPVTLLPDAGARVRVRDAVGRPAAGVWIYTLSASKTLWEQTATHGWQVGARTGKTGEDGLLALPRAPGERLEIHAFPAGSLTSGQTTAGAEATITFGAAGSGRRTLEVREPPPARVAAADPAGGAQEEEPHEAAPTRGSPVPGVVAAIGPLAWPAGRTGADGRLTLTGTPERPVQLYLFAPDGRRLRLDLTPEAGTGDKPLLLTLPPPARSSGRVLAASSRRPLPGALVWPLLDPGAFTFTDARGTWELTTPVEGAFRVGVLAPSFLPQTVRHPAGEAAARQAPTVALEAAAAAHGRVADPEGNPLAGVSLMAVPDPAARPPRFSTGDPAAGRAASDAEGRFTLGGLDPGTAYELTAAHPGFAAAKMQFTAAYATAPGAGVQIVLRPARAGAGRVVDGEDRPLPGVEVTVTAEGGSRRTVSGETGRFEVPELPGTRVDLSASKRGFFPITVRGVEIEPGEAPADLGTLVLGPGAAVFGRVTSGAGEGLAGVEVRVVEDDGRPLPVVAGELRGEKPRAVTGTAGRFRIEDLKPGRRVHLFFEREGYRPARLAAVEVPPPGPLTVHLETAAGSLAGRVTSEDGEPVTGARLRLSRALPPPGTVGVAPLPEEAPRSTSSDARGRFRFTGLAPGEVEIEVEAEGFQRTEPRRLTIKEQGATEDLLLVLARGAIVEGHLRSRDGEPVPGALVRVGPVRSSSDGDGFYHLAGVPPGTYLLSVRHLEYEMVKRRLTVQPGINVRDVTLPAGWPVAGRVVDDEDEPVPGAVLLLRSRGMAGMREYRAAGDGDGRFELPRVVDGHYRVEASHPGYVTGRAAVLDVNGGPVEGVEVRLFRGTTLEGRLLGLAEAELAGAQVEAVWGEQAPGEGAWGEAPLTGRVDYAGNYEIRGLGPGVWQVRAWLPGSGRQAEARVVVPAGGRRQVHDLEFSGDLTLTGQVLFDGMPLSETHVSLLGREVASRRSAITDHDGRFRVEDLEPGRYRLNLANPRESLRYNEDVDLFTDRDLVVEIATTRVAGVVRSASGNELSNDAPPLDDALVSLQQLVGTEGSPGSIVTVATDRAGTFVIDRLSAGRYLLSVRRDGYTPHKRLLDLVAGVQRDDLEIALAPTEGLEIYCRLATGPPLDRASLHVLDANGGVLLSETRGLAHGGYARFPTVPAGTWEVVVTAPGGAATRFTARVPGEALEVVLPPAARLEVRVPALIETNRVATLSLLGPDGRPFRGPGSIGNLQEQWTLQGGAGVVEGLQAGVWTLVVSAPDGQTWQENVALAYGKQAQVILE